MLNTEELQKELDAARQKRDELLSNLIVSRKAVVAQKAYIKALCDVMDHNLS